jgi:hypothetical protein
MLQKMYYVKTASVRARRHTCNVPANLTDQDLSGHCIAGLIDAEAYFGISEMNGGGSFSCHMSLAVRDDDVELLHTMAGTTGLGVVRPRSRAR